MTSTTIYVRHSARSAFVRRRGEPIRLGLPMPRGLVRDVYDCRLLLAGKPVAAQWRPLESWPDGSVRWVLVDWLADIDDSGNARYVFEAHDARPQPAFDGLKIGEHDGAIHVDTGAARFALALNAPLFFTDVIQEGRSSIDGGASALVVTDADGRSYPCVAAGLAVEERGALRATLRVDAHVDAIPDLHVTVRLTFFAGTATTRLSITFRNTRRAAHEGGLWVLGDAGSLRVAECCATFSLPVDEESPVAALSLDAGRPLRELGDAFELLQESSGGPAWDSSTHVNADGVVPLRFRGYRLTSAQGEERGDRATPVTRIATRTSSIAASVPLFWQKFPKAISATGRQLRVALFPSTGELHELQGGEQCTHDILVSFGTGPGDHALLDWLRAPLECSVAPAWYAHAEPGLPLNVLPPRFESQADFDALVASAIEGPASFGAKAERADEYGWRNFGDLVADHEAVGEAGRGVVVSHYNNQYDAIAGFAFQGMRTGDARWWTAMNHLAEHVRDIDVYHTNQDKSAFNGGLFWHTAHYRDAATSTHRSFPRLGGVAGGGPSNEHCYTTGLLLHYLTTGEAASREAVLGLARWILEADDGRRTVFRWLARGDTGLASSTAETTYHGPGRGAANSILAMLMADRLEPEGPWLRKAEALIRRCVHPDDNIDARRLLDAERRWSYTVFLQVLLRYLERKLERDERDGSYGYAAASVVAYARWMQTHEYPYLDKPEILEFPNETWSAQDLRKAEVFYGVAVLVGGDEAMAFRERGDFFFDYSVRALTLVETATLTRPMVLMLSQGMRAREARDPGASWASLEVVAVEAMRGFPPKVHFEPQKIRAMRRAYQLVGLAAGLSAALAGAGVWLMLRNWL